MPSIYYQRLFVPGCYYHLYNRGAHQQLLFKDNKDYLAFTEILRHYLLTPLGTPPSIISRYQSRKHYANSKDPIFVNSTNSTQPYQLLAYCLMPNHFHLMLKQIDENILLTNLMRRLSVAYAMYYNTRYHHSGTILQGKYKNILIENEIQWLYLTKYIHRNPLHNPQSSVLCQRIISQYPYSSYSNYLGVKSESWIHPEEVLARYQNKAFRRYQDFVEDSEVGPIEKLTLDCDEDQ